jgi:hypothetical protein
MTSPFLYTVLVLQIIMVMLKLTEVIPMPSWWVVMIPVLFYLAFVISFFVYFGAGLIFGKKPNY